MEKCRKFLSEYLEMIIHKKISIVDAARKLGYTPQWLGQIKKRYIKEGAACLQHGNKFKPSHRKIADDIRKKIVTLYCAKYEGINFRYFSTCLKTDENITGVSYWTVKSILEAAGLKSPEAHKIKKHKEVHRPRLRREHEGDLIQIDGTPYEFFWKFGNKNKYDCHGSIDDATGKITGLYMTQNECLYGYLEILRQTCLKYGVPSEIYSDRAAIFCVTPREKQNLTAWEALAGIHDKRTQWQRVLSDLNIKQTLAWSPQAKGRVERMWETVQGRLPMFLFLRGADTVEKANKVLPEFIEQFNNEFAVEPAKKDSYYLPVPSNLNEILCAQIPRKTDHTGSLSFHSYKFTIQNCIENVAYKNILLCINESGMFARLNGHDYPLKLNDPYIAAGDVPQVLEDIIYRYMYAYAKEISA